MNNNAIPGDWKKAVVFTIYKGGFRSAIRNYRLFSLTLLVYKQMEDVIVGYVRHLWIMSGWICDSHHDFRPGYSCENQVVTGCQIIAY